MSLPASGLPLPEGYRASGVLLHLTSLPGRFGIGDAGPAAVRWIDMLADADQNCWQFLPLGPTGAGDSPYQSPSTFALNELLVSPEQLLLDGLVDVADCEATGFRDDWVEFGRVIPFKYQLLDRAWANFQRRASDEQHAEFADFRHEQGDWLEDYALFLALKAKFGETYFWQWPSEVVRRDPLAMARLRQELAETIRRFQFRQFLAFRHWQIVRLHAAERGVRLIGDLPIFVSPDSADVWSNPDVFLLDEFCRPKVVAGVPPDYFSPTGQLWGSPLYDWSAQKRDGYRWWVERLWRTLQYVDLIRLDHFRGFEAAWTIPAGAENAIHGHWEPGPGADFLEQVRKSLKGLPLIAEDLGMITDEVRTLRDQFHLPGMRVFQFAFDGDPTNPFLPHNYVENAVAYTGTHDNDTTVGWFESSPEHVRRQVLEYLHLGEGTSAAEVARSMIREALESSAALTIFPVQDLLGLGTKARMNVPGVADGNWGWRMTPEMPVAEALQQLAEQTRRTDRSRLVRS